MKITIVSEKTKDKILHLLMGKELTNNEIASKLGKKLSNIQTHLSILFNEGKVAIIFYFF